MRRYLVYITMPDSSQGQHNGLYADGFEAAIYAIEHFPDAKRISARRLA
ncbi:MAG: hypothetical protein ACT4NV_18025 [Rhodoferax sp.]